MKKLLILLLLLATGLVGASYWAGRRGESTPEADRYTLLPAEYCRSADVVSATGLVQAKDVFRVGTELAGKVTEVLADFNQVVKEGEVLLRMYDRMARRLAHKFVENFARYADGATPEVRAAGPRV